MSLATPHLRELADRSGLLIGTCVSANPLLKSDASVYQQYQRVAAEQFNILTAENAMKFALVAPAPDVYDWTVADAIFEFARKHHQKVRYHTGLWYMQTPAWLNTQAMSLSQIAQTGWAFIEQTGRRYGETMYCWDVVNEALNDPPDAGLWRDCIWLQALGPDYVAQAFKLAHKVAPKALLVYNDYKTTFGEVKADRQYDMVRGLVDRGVPLHAVGFQTHLYDGQIPDGNAITANLSRFAQLGLDIHITELDVAIGKMEGTLEKRLERQARIYQVVLEACLRVPRFKVLQTWGFTDRYSWLPRFLKYPDEAGLYLDADFQPKPAYRAIHKLLSKAGATVDRR